MPVSQVPLGSYGDVPKGAISGPGQAKTDFAVSRFFALPGRDGVRLQFRGELFNAFNHPNFAQPDNFIDDGPGGAAVITSLASSMRQIQFGLRVAF